MKVCPQCSASYEDVMFFCLEDGTPLRSALDAIPSIPVTTEKTLDLPSGEKTLVLPDTFPETIASPTFEESVQKAAWQPNAFPTEAVLPAKTQENKDKIPVLTSLSQDYSESTNGNRILGGVIGGLVLLGSALGGWWLLQPPSKEIAVVNNVNQSAGNSGNLVLPNVGISSTSNKNSNSTSNTNSNNGKTSSNLVYTNQVMPKPSPNKDKSPTSTPNVTPNSTAEDFTVPKTPAPVPKTPPAVPKTIPGGVLNGKAVNLVKPPYPPVAKAAGASGAVSVQVMIDEDGNVISANAVSGHALLRSASEAAARASKFSPTILSGQKVKVTGVIVYNFVAR